MKRLQKCESCLRQLATKHASNKMEGNGDESEGLLSVQSTRDTAYEETHNPCPTGSTITSSLRVQSTRDTVYEEYKTPY